MANVILVDSYDREIGVEEKLAAHEKGLLHRAFSVFIFNPAGDFLIQQRSPGKYHSPNLWSNTACSHPEPGEGTEAAALRRLQEEMGLACPLREVFHLIYRAQLNGLVEYEYDHVLIGTTTEDPVPAPDEVGAWRWLSANELESEVSEHPDQFTHWFRLAFRPALRAFLKTP